MDHCELHLSDASTLPLGFFFEPEWISTFAKSSGFDNRQFFTFRRPTTQILHHLETQPSISLNSSLSWLNSCRSAHHSWRTVDDELEVAHGISTSPKERALRLLLFPNLGDSRATLSAISSCLNLPVVVHDIDPRYTTGPDNKEFTGGLYLELSSHQTRTLPEVKTFLNSDRHQLALDTRDDQSTKWASRQGFANWQSFWQEIGLGNIGEIQLTLIGPRGMSDIFNRRETLAEQQFLWLHQQGWQGPVTVETFLPNLLLANQGKLTNSLRQLGDFVRTTLQDGHPWSDWPNLPPIA